MHTCTYRRETHWTADGFVDYWRHSDAWDTNLTLGLRPTRVGELPACIIYEAVRSC